MRWRTLLPPVIGLLLSVVVCGCGGDDRGASDKWGGMSEEEWRAQYKAKREAEKQESDADAKKLAEAKRAAAKEAQAAKDERKRVFAGSTHTYLSRGTMPDVRVSVGQGRVTGNTSKEPPPIMLPASFAHWIEADYLKARALGAPQLVEAVEHLAMESVGDQRAAELLARLLPPPPEPPADAPRSRPKKGTYGRWTSGDLIEIIVAALGTNGTDAARKTLVQLAAGELETENDRVAAESAVRALVDNPCPENEDVLFDILTTETPKQTQATPRAQRLAARQGVDPERLRKLAFDLLQPVASSGFRLRAAEWMVDPATPAESRERLIELVDRLHPEGLEANALLLTSYYTPPATKTAIMEDFALYSSQALRQMLGFPREHGAPPLQSEWVKRVIDQLWNKKSCAFLGNALDRLGSLEEDGGLEPVVLASTVPADSTRAALYRALTHHWTDGPAALASAGVPEDLTSDPGFVVLVQMLVYKEIPAVRRALMQSSSTRTSAGRMRRLKDAKEAWEGDLGDLAEEWTDYLESVQSQLCGRLFEAARHREAADPAADLSQLPFELHADAKVVGVYHLDWRRDRKETLSPVAADPMEICYVRIEEETRQSKMLGTYRRRLEHCSEREVEGGIILETLQPGSDLGRKRSVAVRVIQATPDVPRLANQDQPMIVEILSIEMFDPDDPRLKTASLTEN